MFPKSAAPAEVDALIEGISSSFTASAGFQSITRSVGPLMGPNAKTGEFGLILEADFSSLDDVMAMLHAESFQDVANATESLGTTLLLFEIATI
jgi:hypothetical protein